MATQMKVNARDLKFRDRSLSGNLWSLIFSVGLPLALVNCLNASFNIMDSFIASSVSSSSVSTVSYLNQIQMIFKQLGGGITVGGSLLISRAYGEGDYEKVRRNVSTLLMISTILSVVFLAIIPFSSPLLRLLGTPELFVETGARYFAVSMGDIIINFYNSVYLGIEKSRGNTRKILYLNLSMITVKLILSYIFINHVLSDIIMIAFAGLIAQAILLTYSLYRLFFQDDCFAFSHRYVSFRRETLFPLLTISMPLVLEKSSFSIGKAIINNMCAFYGEDTIGALGISNNLTSIYNTTQNGMQDGTASIISQNMGNGNPERGRKAFYILLLYNFIISVVGYVLLMTFIIPISHIFSRNSETFGMLIYDITKYNAIGGFMLFISTSVNAFLFGIGKTRLTLFNNVMRLFVFRIPVMKALQRFTDLGSEAAGITMLISNTASAILAIIAAVYVIGKMKKEEAR